MTVIRCPNCGTMHERIPEFDGCCSASCWEEWYIDPEEED
jgi:hypothetical protein